MPRVIQFDIIKFVCWGALSICDNNKRYTLVMFVTRMYKCLLRTRFLIKFNLNSARRVLYPKIIFLIKLLHIILHVYGVFWLRYFCRNNVDVLAVSKISYNKRDYIRHQRCLFWKWFESLKAYRRNWFERRLTLEIRKLLYCGVC